MGMFRINGAADLPRSGTANRVVLAESLRNRFIGLVTLVALVALGIAGCGSNGGNGTGAGSSSSTSAVNSPALSGNITVFAAASLTGSFTELGKQFEAAHPGTKVTFSFAGSSALTEQIKSGAPADVFASASPKNMDQVVSAGAASGAKVFAKNAMEIATPPSNPGKVMSVDDLAKSAVKTAL